MAESALARDTLFALRQKIAKIEGRLAERLEGPDVGFSLPGSVLVRAGNEIRSEAEFVATGVDAFDTALGGGLPKAALTEIHTLASKDAGLSAGFALAIAALTIKARKDAALLWIGTSEIFQEAGFPYAPGIARSFGIKPDNMLFAEARKLIDALWIAEEASRLTALCCVVIEQRGNPGQLDLTATRRLHRRAMASNRPVLLLRQGAVPEPTAAPIRLVLSPAAAAPRRTLIGPVAGTIGPPSFLVTVSKNRAATAETFLLGWNSHDIAFHERETTHSGRVASISGHRTGLATAAGTVVAFKTAARSPATGCQPAGGEHPEDLGARRSG